MICCALLLWILSNYFSVILPFAHIDNIGFYSYSNPMPRWTPETRQKQAEQIRTTRPWRHATGPRTRAGKMIVARNALRHGFRAPEYSAAKRELVEALRAQARSVNDRVRLYRNSHKLLKSFTGAARKSKNFTNKMNKIFYPSFPSPTEAPNGDLTLQIPNVILSYRNLVHIPRLRYASLGMTM
jgi:hypothetical protein